MATEPKTIESSKEMTHQVVSPEQWLKARMELLRKEKEITRMRDELAAERRDLPWEKVSKAYIFDGANGKESLAGLFLGEQQLIVYHFMFGPDWKEGCPSCSFVSDHVDGMLPHLANRGVAYSAVSRASMSQIQAFKKRMGWQFPWVSSLNNDFNADYHVSFAKQDIADGPVYYNYKSQRWPSEEAPGISAFYKDSNNNIFHTYSAFGRGVEVALTTYQFLDLVPKGRDEDNLPHSMAWVRHHDRYENATARKDASCCSGEQHS